MSDQENDVKTTKGKKGCLPFFIVAVLLFTAIGFFMDDEAPQNPTSTPTQKAWYSGGSLHQASALSWQDADYADKLATSADFIATLWNGKRFNPTVHNKIQSVDDIKPFAKELVVFLDKATEKNPDAEQNKKVYTNQKVSDMAVMGMMMMGWTKK
ncbi:hypothetical protein [Desulfoluna butyratoxydans]|uniref:Uncharacterized protein n=1 Tax=Desulfoluna butyratoxydans TaxID=231438 RepID=A0A4U8YP89_9BACT|nr:hypothetical protein [Desulfoluna butyratoxydans]VFQ43482.1 hypothetical protein MSL71_11170 [Desulfoluna butyratoxydans]